MKKILYGVILSSLISISAMALSVPKSHVVDAAWLQANMQDKNLIIVDVRGKAYKKSHISGAVAWKSSDFREGRYYSKITQKPIPGYIVAPLKFLITMQTSGVNNDSAIVFYHAGLKPKDYRDAALAAFTAEYYGFSNVAILDGGFAGWEKANGAVDSKKAGFKHGNFSFEGRKFNHDILATGEDIDEAIWTKNAQTVDTNGKSKLHWYGKDGDEKDLRRLSEGHLEGAKALHPKDLVVAKDGVYYLGDKALAMAKFEKAGIDTNKNTIFYCNTGHLAAGVWFVGKYLLDMKENSKLYSGSMADYTRWPNRELIKGDE